MVRMEGQGAITKCWSHGCPFTVIQNIDDMTNGSLCKDVHETSLWADMSTDTRMQKNVLSGGILRRFKATEDLEPSSVIDVIREMPQASR